VAVVRRGSIEKFLCWEPAVKTALIVEPIGGRGLEKERTQGEGQVLENSRF